MLSKRRRARFLESRALTAMPLEEQFYETSAIRWKRALPWLRIFRGFRLAIDVRKMALAVMALLIFTAGNRLLDWLPFSPASRGEVDRVQWMMDISLPGFSTSVPDEAPLAFEGADRIRPPVVRPTADRKLLSPWSDIAGPLLRLVQRGNSWSDVAWAWTKLLWVLLVAAVFGGAISRIAALELAGEGSPSFRGALQHSTSYLSSYLGGPLLPMIGVGVLWALGAIAGMIGLIPGIGPVVLGAFWFVPLIFGAALALVLIGILLAWPLMYCAISVEGSDAFDGFSRAYSYIFGRGWYALFILALTLLYGAALLLFLSWAVDFAIHLTNWAAAGGVGEGRLRDFFGSATRIGGSGLAGFAFEQRSPDGAAARMAGLWTDGFAGLLQAFVVSFFWCGATIAYFLLRHAEDATPFNRVYWPAPAAPPSDGPPLSGIASAERREQQLAPPAEAPSTEAGEGEAPSAPA